MLSRCEIVEGQKHVHKISNKKVKLQLDTGSDISIIEEETFKKLVNLYWRKLVKLHIEC